MIKAMRKIGAALLLALCVLLLPAPANAADTDAAGYFYLSVAVQDRVIIAPARVSYTAGQSVLDALEACQYDFRFLGEDKTFVESIEGVSGNFVRFHDYSVDGNDYDLTVPAEKIRVLAFAEKSGLHTPEMVSLICRLGELGESDGNVLRYPAAAKAYENALMALRGASAEEAKAQLDALNAAAAEYEALLNGTKYTVTFDVRQNGAAVTAPHIRMTDAYGNVTETDAPSISVVAGEYAFEITDGGYNAVRGTITVEESTPGTPVAAELPYGSWFGTVRLSRFSLGNYDEGVYPAEYQNANEGTFYVPDCTTLLHLNAQIGAVPDENTTKLRAIYTKTTGEDMSETPRSWNSTAVSMASFLSFGMEGRSVSLEARYELPNGFTQVQTYVMHILRTPTLASVTAIAPDGTAQILSPEFDPFTKEYAVTSVTERLRLAAEGYGASYTITGTGDVQTAADTDAVLAVSAGDRTETYTLHIKSSPAAAVTVQIPADCTAEIRDAAGNAVPMSANGTYAMVPGSAYTCVTTKNVWYHASVSFTAADGMTVAAPEPDTADAITAAALYNNLSSTARREYTPETAFTAAAHSIRYVIPDTQSRLYAQATAADGYGVTAIHPRLRVSDGTITGTQETGINYGVGDASAQTLINLINGGGTARTFTLRASRTDGDITYYQDYTVFLARSLHLKNRSLTLTANGEELMLTNAAGEKVTFDGEVYDYHVQVPNTTESVVLTAEFAQTGEYTARINGGEPISSLGGVSVPLDTDKTNETITVEVLHADTNAVSGVYTVRVTKKEPVAITFAVTPQDANVFLVNNNTGKYAYTDANGTVMLAPGASYRYTVTRTGYIGQQVTEFIVPEAAETITAALEKAPERSSVLPEEVWSSFRADKYNNGVVNAKTPTTAEDAVLYWATQLGEGYSADACGCPILVGDYLYTYAKSSIYKLNVVTGAVEATGTMDHSSSFAINSPTYAEGMIFVGLSDGTVQAFDAETLTSLWIYRDPLGGQPNCPIYYHNGCIYTGFWQGEELNASFVCLTVTDEDPTRTNEEKLASWQYASRGGFYWAGAYVTDKYVLIPTDDGASGYTTGYASLLSLDTRSGALISSVKLPHTGDARSSVVYSGGRAYFTTKGGYFYSVAVAEDGTLSDLRYIKLYNYADDAANPAMSTCSPVIYNGRAYIGVSGTGQFKAYSGHNITVIDLASWRIAYTVRTQGYPQTSGLLTTAYDEGDGTVYVYFFDNYTPGKLRVLRDRPGQTSPDLTVTETVTVQGREVSYETASVLFTPDGAQAQYAICSPITDESGTIYFKNDSAYMMALGSVITELRVDEQPEKLTYRAGETFDAAGMKITAVYKNGFERDVTDYVTFSQQPLGAEDSTFEIRFEHVMYQDKDGAGGSQYPAAPPAVTLTLTINPSVPGDVDADGKVTAKDAAKVAEHVRSTESGNAEGFRLTEEQLEYADVDGDGAVTMADAERIWQYSRGEITAFPQTKSADKPK